MEGSEINRPYSVSERDDSLNIKSGSLTGGIVFAVVEIIIRFQGGIVSLWFLFTKDWVLFWDNCSDISKEKSIKKYCLQINWRTWQPSKRPGMPSDFIYFTWRMVLVFRVSWNHNYKLSRFSLYLFLEVVSRRDLKSSVSITFLQKVNRKRDITDFVFALP